MESLKEIAPFLEPHARLDLKAVAVSYILSEFEHRLNAIRSWNSPIYQLVCNQQVWPEHQKDKNCSTNVQI